MEPSAAGPLEEFDGEFECGVVGVEELNAVGMAGGGGSGVVALALALAFGEGETAAPATSHTHTHIRLAM